MLHRPPCRFACCLLTTLWLGCSTAKTVDVLESRLRHQEDMLATYESEMQRVKSELSVARSEAEDLRLQLAESGQPTIPAEESGALFRTAGIQFSALMTGGTDVDGVAGHDGLSVVLIPHDHDGELVKLPGNIEIEAFDLSQPGGAKRIGHWSFDQREIHNYWHKGVIQSGYQFELPWQSPPASESVLLVGHLSAANGRKFETTLTVKIDPPNPGLADSRTSESSFAAEQASAISPESDVIWADGESPVGQDQSSATRTRGFTQRNTSPTFGASPFRRDVDSETSTSSDRAMTRSDLTRELDRTSPLSSQKFPLESRAPTEVPTPAPDESASPPPPLEDWWSDDDWATENSLPTNEPAVRTSDSFTEETLPLYR